MSCQVAMSAAAAVAVNRELETKVCLSDVSLQLTVAPETKPVA